MSCAAITDAFLAETGRLSTSDYFIRTARKRPIVDLMMQTRGAWQDGMGVVVSNVTQARNFPLDAVASRTAVSVSDAIATSACDPPIVTLVDGQIVQPYRLNHLNIQTQDYCIKDIRYDWQFERVMAARRKQLADISSWVWADWFTKDYVDIAGHNITQQLGGFTDNGSSGYSAAAPPTAALSVGTLEEISQQMFNDGDQPLGFDMDTQEPIEGLIIGKSTADMLFRTNPELLTSLRYGWMGKEGDAPNLPSGQARKRKTFAGWFFIYDPYPRRFNLVGGAYVQQQPWVSTSASKGTQQIANPGYKYAQYEEVIPYNRSNYRSLAFNTMGNPSPGWKFDPVNYYGEFQALNILNKECNPRGEKLFWDAVFMDAAEPLNPNGVGFSILVKNCGYDRSGNACTAASSSSA
jgi:hypothetical protein